MSKIKRLDELSSNEKSQWYENAAWRSRNRWWINKINKIWLYSGVFRPLLTPLLKFTKPSKNGK